MGEDYSKFLAVWLQEFGPEETLDYYWKNESYGADKYAKSYAEFRNKQNPHFIQWKHSNPVFWNDCFRHFIIIMFSPIQTLSRQEPPFWFNTVFFDLSVLDKLSQTCKLLSISYQKRKLAGKVTTACLSCVQFVQKWLKHIMY